MKSETKKYLIICIVIVLVVLSILFTIFTKKHRKNDVFKNTNVSVTVNMDDTSTSSTEDVELTASEQEADEKAGHVTSDASVIDAPLVTTTEKTEEEETTQEGDTENGEPAEEDTEITYSFSYSSITEENYVNFIEQLCSVNFETPNVDIDSIPLSDTVKTQLQNNGSVSTDALTYSFITTDQGFNNDDNSFFVIIHIPNETKDYVLIEGVIEDTILVSLDSTVMR